MVEAFNDPADWSSASVSPDFSAIDGLDDVLMEVASEELKSRINPCPPKLVRTVAKIARVAIQRATDLGLLHGDEDGSFTPQFRESLARLLAEVIDSPNARLHAQCIDFVFELGIQMGVSQVEIAGQHSMTRANVSKICVGLRERYHVRPSRGMKSMSACKNYSARQTGRRAKPAREDWRLGAALKTAFYGDN